MLSGRVACHREVSAGFVPHLVLDQVSMKKTSNRRFLFVYSEFCWPQYPLIYLHSVEVDSCRQLYQRRQLVELDNFEIALFLLSLL